jgi:hypothetical protein
MVQAVVGVLTIPLTLAVCSTAAVIFTQSGSRQWKLTLRHTMTLADKGGTEVGLMGHIRLLGQDRANVIRSKFCPHPRHELKQWFCVI